MKQKIEQQIENDEETVFLSSPIANISGIIRNARNGILIKGSVFLELLDKLNTIVFDKTGTLTKGKPHLV